MFILWHEGGYRHGGGGNELASLWIKDSSCISWKANSQFENYDFAKEPCNSSEFKCVSSWFPFLCFMVLECF